MLRRLFSPSHLRSLPTALSPSLPRFAAPLLTRHVTAQSGSSIRKRVEDVVPIATGHEREEIQAELEGRDILEINHPIGPFGTKEAPAVVKSYFDRRIVGCPGCEGEDEHDVVWFWLEKGKQIECPVCSQYFVLDVVGPGGDPYGHGDHDHH
ncbi:cytochrome c oxidase subunit 5b-2, mitochondrial-like [Abrus precatorius]|uniref:Cytochrome c oxidase subunit 5b-2, mitochondrial-like n=1 Tax=Abrus precatorius TaxID=3816 RepID=A0A8B8KKH8_ABRPR|nr:cytochrome c oxidase subunit 5b-2, mitochondrial-like [Abrus precatorius]